MTIEQTIDDNDVSAFRRYVDGRRLPYLKYEALSNNLNKLAGLYVKQADKNVKIPREKNKAIAINFYELAAATTILKKN